jgi:hypothetical protein
MSAVDVAERVASKHHHGTPNAKQVDDQPGYGSRGAEADWRRPGLVANPDVASDTTEMAVEARE